MGNTASGSFTSNHRNALLVKGIAMVYKDFCVSHGSQATIPLTVTTPLEVWNIDVARHSKDPV